MFTYILHDYDMVSCKLDDVAGLYIIDEIIRSSHIFIDSEKKTESFPRNVTGLHLDDYIHMQIISCTSDYYKDGCKYKARYMTAFESCFSKLRRPRK